MVLFACGFGPYSFGSRLCEGVGRSIVRRIDDGVMGFVYLDDSTYWAALVERHAYIASLVSA